MFLHRDSHIEKLRGIALAYKLCSDTSDISGDISKGYARAMVGQLAPAI